MPGYLLDALATALCVHGGKAMPTAPSPRVTMTGRPAVTQPVPYVVAGCPFVTPAAVPLPCLSATWVTASLRVKSMGQPVLLTSGQALTAPTPAPLNVIPGQTRVKAQ